MKIANAVKSPSKFLSSDHKFGTFKGVFLPNILQMIGVILFFRLGWILGHVGIFEMSMIISLSSLILLITGFSITAIATNMQIGAGGTYYILSRSLGIEFGSAIGMLICISQITSIALYISGFAVSLQEFFPEIQLQVFQIGTLLLLTFISYISTNFALQTQALIFCALLVSLAALFSGNASNIPSEMHPLATSSQLSFWLAFSMFFPAATGIETGLSMSGDLKRPSRSIPLGTIGAILAAYLLYLNLAFFFSKQVPCEMLRSYPFIVYHLSKYGILIVVGIWAATISSALGGILAAPRILQAVAIDGILPKFFGKGFGKTSQPRIATLTIFLFTLAMILLINIDLLIPILTMVCLVTYGLLNFVAFFEELIKNPSWRPTFRIPWIISLLGSLGCFMIMFMINAGATFIVLAALIALCIFSSMRKLKGNWEDIRFSIFLFIINKAIKKIQAITKNSKNWRPHILSFILSHSVNVRDLIAFSHALNQDRGFLTFSLCLPESEKCSSQEVEFKKSFSHFLEEIEVPSFHHVNHCKNLLKNIEEVSDHYGLGPLTPDTLIIPYTESLINKEHFIEFIYAVHFKGKNLILFKAGSEISTAFLKTKKGKVPEKEIHLWWEKKDCNNFNLCLVFAQIMRNSPDWHHSKIIVNTLVANEDQGEAVRKEWDEYSKMIRMKNLTFSTHREQEVHAFDENADLAFFLLPQPIEGKMEEYKESFSRLCSKTEKENKIAFVLAGNKIDFNHFFS